MVNEATAKARRSEALFRSSNAGISRRWLTDKVADLEWECARLRVQLEDATASNGRLEERCSKLCELVRHMNTCMEHYEPDGSVSCDLCPLDNDTGNCDYEQRMCELGIEADS